MYNRGIITTSYLKNESFSNQDDNDSRSQKIALKMNRALLNYEYYRDAILITTRYFNPPHLPYFKISLY